MIKAWPWAKLRNTVLVIGISMLTGCGGGGGRGNGHDPLLDRESGPLKQTQAQLRSALEKGDAETAATHFTPDVQESFRRAFQSQPDKMDDLSQALATMKIDHVVEATYAENLSEVRAWVSLDFNGETYHALLIKIDGTWKFSVL